MIIANYKKIVRRKDKHYLSPKTVVFVKYSAVGRVPSGANTQPLGVMLYASIFFLKTTKKKDVCFDHSRGLTYYSRKLSVNYTMEENDKYQSITHPENKLGTALIYPVVY